LPQQKHTRDISSSPALPGFVTGQKPETVFVSQTLNTGKLFFCLAVLPQGKASKIFSKRAH
jgi:hypothetical protein